MSSGNTTSAGQSGEDLVRANRIIPNLTKGSTLMITQPRLARLRSAPRVAKVVDKRSASPDRGGRLIHLALGIYLLPCAFPRAGCRRPGDDGPGDCAARQAAGAFVGRLTRWIAAVNSDARFAHPLPALHRSRSAPRTSSRDDLAARGRPCWRIVFPTHLLGIPVAFRAAGAGSRAFSLPRGCPRQRSNGVCRHGHARPAFVMMMAARQLAERTNGIEDRWQAMTAILGVSAFYHDSAAALVVDGRIVAAAQEERFTRIKHDPAFPAVRDRLLPAEGGTTAGRPGLRRVLRQAADKFERLLETYLAYAPRRIPQLPAGDADLAQGQAAHAPNAAQRFGRRGPGAADLHRPS